MKTRTVHLNHLRENQNIPSIKYIRLSLEESEIRIRNIRFILMHFDMVL